MGINLGAAQVVTTVWGTRLGTKLLNGFNSTTDDTAYFRCLLLHPGLLESTIAPSSSPVWSRHPGRLLLRAPTDNRPLGSQEIYFYPLERVKRPHFHPFW